MGSRVIGDVNFVAVSDRDTRMPLAQKAGRSSNGTAARVREVMHVFDVVDTRNLQKRKHLESCRLESKWVIREEAFECGIIINEAIQTEVVIPRGYEHARLVLLTPAAIVLLYRLHEQINRCPDAGEIVLKTLAFGREL